MILRRWLTAALCVLRVSVQGQLCSVFNNCPPPGSPTIIITTTTTTSTTATITTTNVASSATRITTTIFTSSSITKSSIGPTYGAVSSSFTAATSTTNMLTTSATAGVSVLPTSASQISGQSTVSSNGASFVVQASNIITDSSVQTAQTTSVTQFQSMTFVAQATSTSTTLSAFGTTALTSQTETSTSASTVPLVLNTIGSQRASSESLTSAAERASNIVVVATTEDALRSTLTSKSSEPATQTVMPPTSSTLYKQSTMALISVVLIQSYQLTVRTVPVTSNSQIASTSATGVTTVQQASQVPAILGGLFAALVFCGLLFAGAYLMLKRRRMMKDSPSSAAMLQSERPNSHVGLMVEMGSTTSAVASHAGTPVPESKLVSMTSRNVVPQTMRDKQTARATRTQFAPDVEFGAPSRQTMSRPTKRTQFGLANTTTRTAVNDQREMSIPGYLILEEDVDFKVLDPIAQGGFASIYTGELISQHIIDDTGVTQVAVKIMLEDETMTQEERDEEDLAFIQEVSLMNFFRNSRHCVKLVGYSVEPATIVMKMYKLGTLTDVLIGKSPVPWSVNLAIQLLRDVAEGLVEFHKNGMAHLDIKPANILLDQDMNGPFAVLSDFGIAQIVNEKSLLVPQFQVSKLAGVTLDYACPELLKVMGTKDKPSSDESTDMQFKFDVYAFSIMAFEMVMRLPAYKGMARDTLAGRVLTGLRPQFPPSTDIKMVMLADLATRGWNHKASLRPGMLQMQHMLESLLKL